MNAVNYKKMVPRDVTGRVRYPHEASRRERWRVGTVTTGFEVVFTGIHSMGHPSFPATVASQELPLVQMAIPSGGGSGVCASLGVMGCLNVPFGDIDNSSSSNSYVKSDPGLPYLRDAFTDGKDLWTVTGVITRPDTRDLLALTFASTYYPGESWTVVNWDGGTPTFEGAKELWLGMLDPRVMDTVAVEGWYVGQNAMLWGHATATIITASVS